MTDENNHIKMSDEQFDQFVENFLEAFPEPTFWERVHILRARSWAAMAVIGAFVSLVMSAIQHDSIGLTLFCAVFAAVLNPILTVLCNLAWEQVTAKD